jgi:hypothetical protein
MPMPGLGRDHHGIGGVKADDFLDLLLDPVGLGRRQVDLVEHRHDLVVGIKCGIDIGQRLRFDALAGVNHQQRAFAGPERARHLVGEVDMARRVDQVEDINLAILGLVVQPHGLGLDGDAPLLLDVHGIENLLAHLTVGKAAAGLDQPVGQRRLAVIDMGNNRKVADMGEWRVRVICAM